jgi:hypothetical protein
MGMAATNRFDRVAASMGLLDELEPAFATAVDIPQGGVLFALPALLANGLLSDQQQPSQWASELCRGWMEDAPDLAGTLYIDGHVRVYHGRQTALPKHYVARQKLCLRATTDY